MQPSDPIHAGSETPFIINVRQAKPPTIPTPENRSVVEKTLDVSQAKYLLHAVMDDVDASPA